MTAGETENSSLTVYGTPGPPRPRPSWQFQPGVSPNPGGRPKGLAALVREATAEGAELVAFMLGVLRSRRQPLRYRLEAAQWLADRGFGKALQQVEVGTIEDRELVIRVEYVAEQTDAHLDG